MQQRGNIIKAAQVDSTGKTFTVNITIAENSAQIFTIHHAAIIRSALFELREIIRYFEIAAMKIINSA
jgi:hypothetical protein